MTRLKFSYIVLAFLLGMLIQKTFFQKHVEASTIILSEKCEPIAPETINEYNPEIRI